MFPAISHPSFLSLGYILRQVLPEYWLYLPIPSPPTTLDSHSTSLETSAEREHLFPSSFSKNPGANFDWPILGHVSIPEPTTVAKGMWCFDWLGLSACSLVWNRGDSTQITQIENGGKMSPQKNIRGLLQKAAVQTADALYIISWSIKSKGQSLLLFWT